MLTELEKKIIASIQGDIAVTKRPYLELSEKIGISEDTFLAKLKDLCERGVIRRFGATIRHQKSGFAANAMVAWKIDEASVNEVGQTMAASSHVSHCYRRSPNEQWPYNLYTMIHARDEESCREIARRLSDKTCASTYVLLFSREELKKISMKYFNGD